MRLGLVYLPDPAASETCVALSEALTNRMEARLVLGKEKLAHVTLLHVETNEPPDVFWRDVSAVVPHELTLSFAALAFLRYDVPYNAPPTTPGTMAYLIVPCSVALRNAEQRALEVARRLRDGEITTGNDERFMPHVTVAIWDGESLPTHVALRADAVDRRGVRGRLALGVIGPNGVYERTLVSA